VRHAEEKSGFQPIEAERITTRLPRLAFGSRPSGTGLWPVR